MTLLCWVSLRMTQRFQNATGQRSMATPEPWNWEFGADAWNIRRMYSVYNVVVSFQQEVCDWENIAWSIGEEAAGSQVQYGGFHILLPFNWGRKYWEDAHHRHYIVYVNHNLLIYHNKQWEEEGLDVVTWQRRWQHVGELQEDSNQIKVKEKGRCVCMIQASIQNCLLNSDLCSSHTRTCIHANM